jgi:hypothetical protein
MTTKYPDDDASSVEKPSEAPPDEGKVYDPSVTEGDEANIPPGSEADPNASEDAQDKGSQVEVTDG